MGTESSFESWLQFELWTLREAAYLLCGKLPPFNEDGFLAEMKSGSDVALAYRWLKDSTRAETLKFIKADGRDTFMRRLVRPADAVAWAKKRGMPLPDVLKALESVGMAEPAAAEPVPTVADDKALRWWRTAYDIPELAKNIGDKLHSEGKRTSKIAIAKEIESRINAIERSKGKNRKSPNWDTIRGVLPKWRKSPD